MPSRIRDSCPSSTPDRPDPHQGLCKPSPVCLPHPLTALALALLALLASLPFSATSEELAYSFLRVTDVDSWEPAINNSGEIVYIARDSDGYLNVFSTRRGQLTRSRSQATFSPSISDRGEVVHADRDGPAGRLQILSTQRGPYSTDWPASLPSISDSGEVCFLQTARQPMTLRTDRRGVILQLTGSFGSRCDINRAGEIVYRDIDGAGRLQVFSTVRGQLTRDRTSTEPVASATINNWGRVAYVESGAIKSVESGLVARFDQRIGVPIDMNDHQEIVFPLLANNGLRIVLATQFPARHPQLHPLEAQKSDSAHVEVTVVVNPATGSNWFDPNASGLLSVAILSTQIESDEGFDFDAARIDPLSVKLAPAGATIVIRSMSEMRDVDGDGDLDLHLRFRGRQTGIPCDHTRLTLEGETIDGKSFSGASSISTPRCP